MDVDWLQWNALSNFWLLCCIGIVVGDCGQLVYNADSGKFFFKSEVSHTSCIYRIRPDKVLHERKSYYTVLKFGAFSMNGGMPNCKRSDNVIVYIGCKSRRKITTLCSNGIKPHDIYSKDACISVHVQLNKQEGRRLLEMSYQIYSSNGRPFGDCDFESVNNKRSGVFGSPEWPNHYHIDSFDSDRKCIWRAVNQTTAQRVQVNIMDLDLATYSSTCNKKTDMLELKVWPAHDGYDPYVLQYCYWKYPTSLYDSIYKFELKLSVNKKWSTFIKKGRGFVVGYLFYDESLLEIKEESKHATLNIIIAIAVVVFVLTTVAVVIYKIKTRRQIEEEVSEGNQLHEIDGCDRSEERSTTSVPCPSVVELNKEEREVTHQDMIPPSYAEAMLTSCDLLPPAYKEKAT